MHSGSGTHHSAVPERSHIKHTAFTHDESMDDCSKRLINAAHRINGVPTRSSGIRIRFEIKTVNGGSNRSILMIGRPQIKYVVHRDSAPHDTRHDLVEEFKFSRYHLDVT